SCDGGVAQASGDLSVGARAARRGGKRNTQGFLGSDRPHREQHIGAALDDRGAEEPLRGRRRQVGRGTEPAGRLAADRHAVRISAEMPDVVADPLECELLVHEPVIATNSVAVQGRVGEPAKRPEAIIDGDDNDLAGADEDAGIESRASAVNKRAAMNEDPNGELVVVLRLRGCCDIEEETIFTEGRRRRKLIDLLRTWATWRGGVEYRLRAHRSRGRCPTVRAGRRVGVADALELVDDTVAHAADWPAPRLDDAGRGVGHRGGHSENYKRRRQEADARASKSRVGPSVSARRCVCGLSNAHRSPPRSELRLESQK